MTQMEALPREASLHHRFCTFLHNHCGGLPGAVARPIIAVGTVFRRHNEDTAGQCGDISADGEIFIFTKYGVVITGDTDEDVIVLYLDHDPEDTPVGSIQPRNGDAVVTDDKSNAEPANEQETIASQVIVLEGPSVIGGEDADDIATTGPTARSLPAAAEPVEDTRTIE